MSKWEKKDMKPAKALSGMSFYEPPRSLDRIDAATKKRLQRVFGKYRRAGNE